MSGLASEFVSVSCDRLEKSFGKIESCVAKLSPEQVRTRHSENENAVGNLLLHLTGNLRQWILTGLAGAPDTRVRELEFSARGTVPPEEALAGLRAAVDEAVRVMRGLPAAALMERITVFGTEVTKMEAVFHVVEHFAGHTFQIIFVTKWFTGEDLGLTRLPPNTHVVPEKDD